LGLAVATPLEVTEAIETLHGGGPADFRNIVWTLLAEMLLWAKLNHTEGRFPAAEAAIENGSAWAKFGSSSKPKERPGTSRGPSATTRCAIVAPLPAPSTSYVARVDAREIGSL